MSVQVSYRKQFFLGIMLLVVLLVVVEGFANIWWYQVNVCAFEDSKLFEDLNIEEKRQLCLENLELQVTELGIEPNQKSGSIHVNSEGFRSPEITKEKPEGTYRIFLVGGSTTFGSGVKDDETLSAHLQKLFDEVELDFKVEVINAGIPGAWSKVEVKFVKERLLEYEPDLFIIYDGVNDLNKINDPLGGPVIWKDRWLEICNMGKEHGFDTIITIQPILGTGKRIPSDQVEPELLDIINSGYLEPYPLFVEQLKELDIFCSTTSDLRGIFDNVKSTIFFDIAHINSLGNKIVAEAFYNTSLPIVLKKTSDIVPGNGEVFKSKEKTDGVMSNIKNDLILNDSVNMLRKLFLSYKTPRIMLNLSTVFSFEIPQQTTDQKESERQKQSPNRINFNGEDLSGLDFSNHDLENIVFYKANLNNVNFENSNLAGVDFRFAEINGINFKNAKMQGANLSHLDLRDVDLSGLDLSNTNLSQVDLSGSNLTDSILINANLVGANLENAIFTNTDMSAANLNNANLRHTIFTNSDLTLANLENADISNSEFNTIIMQATILINANLTNSKINNSDLSGANLQGVILEGTMIEETRLVCFNNSICD